MVYITCLQQQKKDKPAIVINMKISKLMIALTPEKLLEIIEEYMTYKVGVERQDVLSWIIFTKSDWCLKQRENCCEWCDDTFYHASIMDAPEPPNAQ